MVLMVLNLHATLVERCNDQRNTRHDELMEQSNGPNGVEPSCHIS